MPNDILDEIEARWRHAFAPPDIHSLIEMVRERDKALQESVALQSHYAALLNDYDGGKRRGFATAEEWVARLRETGALAALDTAASPGAEAMTELSKETLWRDLLEKDDRTSPEECPDMALITFDEFCYCIEALTEQRVAAAVLAERERCAQEAEAFGGADDIELATVIRARPAPEGAAPIPMVLFCPACGAQHVDKANWESPPHRTHQCQGCGHLWRPASVYTEGVADVPLGTSDTRPAIRDLARHRCSTPSQGDTGSVGGEKLWLWKNGDHYLAFAHKYPTYGGGDPMVLGEPLGYAMLVPSEPRRAEPPTDAGGPGSASNTESSPTQTVAPPGPTAGDVERARSIIDDAANIVGGPEAGVLCKGIAVALAAERASERAELLAQIREEFDNLSIAVDGFAEVVGFGEERAIIGGKELEVRRYMRALADKLTEAK